MHFVDTHDVRDAAEEAGDLSILLRGLGRTRIDPDTVARLGLPLHLDFLVKELEDDDVYETLSSIPFYSLCRGLLLPLSAMAPEKAAQIFGLVIEPPPATEAREAMLRHFLERDLGLSMRQKLSCLLGDPFGGRPSTMKRESLLRLLQSEALVTRRELLDRLTLVGDVAILFADARTNLRGEPALTASEVLLLLERLPSQKRTFQYQLLRSVFERCGKLEAYFLAKLIMQKAGLRYESELLARLLGEHYNVEAEQISHANALSDPFEVVRLLEESGIEGLRSVQLQPLVPVRPALASGGTTEQIKRFPVWVERKYDGIRLMLHKATDPLGSVLCGAYSRNRRDYLEMVPSLAQTARMLPAQSTIVDGELHGTVMDVRGPRPASVYEVFGALSGEAPRPVQLKYAAFDLLYLDGHDLTGQTLRERRQRLQYLLGPVVNLPMPIPVSFSEGQMASSSEDVKRLYEHFRNQGYEGVIAKDIESPYRLASRDSSWLKRKPAETLDLVLLGAILAVTSKEKTGMFGSYIIGARSPEMGFEDVGDVAGVDQVKDAEIQRMIMSDGLLTGRRIERAGVSGIRPGFDLTPSIVVMVRVSGVVRDPVSGKLHLRDPKLIAIRADKQAHEASGLKDIESLYLRQQMG
ncbi:MAG: hypothetical protein AAGD38_14325 [Acidobacteriota bacterium]